MALSGSCGARLGTLTPDRVDAAIALSLCAIALLEVALNVASPSALEVLLVAVLALPLAWRRTMPPAAALIVTGALAAQAAFPTEPLFTQTFMGFICVFVAAYSLGRHARREAFRLAIVGCGAAVGLTIGVHDASVASGAFGAVIVLGCGLGGRGIRRRVRVREILEMQARELEASSDAATKAAAIEERLEIAGELEDVVSHRVCEMIVQTQAARRLAATEPARAGAALALVEGQGREALAEMRQLLGVLRGGDDETALSPFPSVTRVAALVERMRSDRLQIELIVEGEREALPAGVDVAAYRVIEATLRDAAQRSAGGPVRVTLRHVRRAVEIEIVEDAWDGTPTAAAAAPTRATIGISERVAAFGGELRMTARRDGAYEVLARLPLDVAARPMSAPPSPPIESAPAPARPAARTLRQRLGLARRRRQADVLLVVALTAAIAAEAATVSAREGSVIANALVAVLVGAALLMRGRFPLAAAAAGWGAVLFMSGVLTPATELTAILAAILLWSYATGAHEAGGRARAGLLLGLGGLVALNLLAPAAPQSEDLVFPAALIALAWLIGRMVRAETAMTAEVAQRAQRIERARESKAAVAAAEERERMARELHDVVAHALTIMVVQAAGARRNVERSLGPASQAIRAVEQAGREALTELRRLLTLSGPAEAGPLLAPQPGLGQIDALVERTRVGGLPVELRIEGQPVSLPGGLDLAAYRVVQEALTNALRHAGPAHASVTIHYAHRHLLLRIRDDGHPTAGTPTPGAGHGIAGMRERIRLYGGELDAGPRRGGGFEVAAILPLAFEPPQLREVRRAVEHPSRRETAQLDRP